MYAHLFASRLVLNYRPVLFVQRVPHHDAMAELSLKMRPFDRECCDVIQLAEVKLKHCSKNGYMYSMGSQSPVINLHVYMTTCIIKVSMDVFQFSVNIHVGSGGVN